MLQILRRFAANAYTRYIKMVDGTFAAVSAETPAISLRAVSPHASEDLPEGVCRALWIGNGGNISVLAEADAAPVTINGVAAGQILPIRAKAVRVTGTTASQIVALY